MKQWWTRSRKRITKAALVAGVACLRLLSRMIPFPAAVALGGVLGHAAYYVLPRDRGRAVQHLTMVFPDRDSAWIRVTARRMYGHLGRSLLEVLALTPRKIDFLVEWEGREKLKQTLKIGKGLIFVTGHIGNWEIMAAAVAAQCPLSVIAAPIEPEALNETIIHLRADLDIRTIVRSRKDSTKELIRVFRENRVLGLLIDQDTDVDGVFVDFMGKPAWTPSAAAYMAIKFGAPVVFGYIHRIPGNRHRIVIEGPIDLAITGDTKKDIEMNTSLLTKRIEQIIMQYPEQWVWMHRRWRRQP